MFLDKTSERKGPTVQNTDRKELDKLATVTGVLFSFISSFDAIRSMMIRHHMMSVRAYRTLVKRSSTPFASVYYLHFCLLQSLLSLFLSSSDVLPSSRHFGGRLNRSKNFFFRDRFSIFWCASTVNAQSIEAPTRRARKTSWWYYNYNYYIFYTRHIQKI